MRKSRKVMIFLDCLIAVLGVAAGICHYITYRDWQVIAWAVVLACACWRSAMGQSTIARMEVQEKEYQMRFKELHERIEKYKDMSDWDGGK